MPDRIPVFQGQIGVQDPGSFRPVLPDRIDAGDEISRLGGSLLRAAEPFVERDLERDAIAAAGVADIVKDDQGNFLRAPMPRGAGTKYADAYQRVMDSRLLELTTKSFEQAIDQLPEEDRRDTQTYAAKLAGTAQGIVEGADPVIRAQLETALTREVSERVRGVAQLNVSRQYQAAIGGQRDTVNTAVKNAARLYAIGGPGAQERVDVELGRAMGALTTLKAMGEIDDDGLKARYGEIIADLGDDKDLYATMETMRSVGAVLGKASLEDLQALSAMADGLLPLDTVVAGLTVQQWYDATPSRSGRRIIGGAAQQMLNARVEAQRAAAAADRDRAQLNAITSLQFTVTRLRTFSSTFARLWNLSGKRPARV